MRNGYLKHMALAAAALAAVAAAQARTAADFFVGAPDEAMILFDKSTRMDMLDYFNSGLPTFSTNRTGGSARILAAEPGRLELLAGRDSNIRIGVMTDRGDTTLVVIETVLTPVADSHVRLYDRNWRPRSPQLPAMPSAMDFVAQADRKSAARADMPDVCFVVADYNPADGTFTMTDTTAGAYVAGDEPDGLRLMRQSIRMKYDGRRFVELKNKDSK